MNIVTVSYHSTNYYALEIKTGKLLVDCGWPGTLPQFTAELKRKGIAPGEIKFLLVTHFHPDHAGLVQEFKNMGAKLILLESQMGFIGQLNNMMNSKNISFLEIKDDDNILLKFSESREYLASLGIIGEIINTPGHSDDSITLILDEGIAFTGDLPPRSLVMEDDLVKRDSWERIDQHKIKLIFPAHGK
jgi:ribonuclease/clavin/mitogillin